MGSPCPKMRRGGRPRKTSSCGHRPLKVVEGRGTSLLPEPSKLPIGECAKQTKTASGASAGSVQDVGLEPVPFGQRRMEEVVGRVTSHPEPLHDCPGPPVLRDRERHDLGEHEILEAESQRLL